MLRSKELQDELHKLSTELSEWHELLPNKDIIRSRLATIGHFNRVLPFTHEELQCYFKERPLVAVDGSINTYGGSFPNWISFFQALAKSTVKIAGEHKLIQSELFSPLRKEDRKHMMSWGGDGGHPVRMEAQLAEDYCKYKLAEMEIVTAMRGIQHFSPKVVLMDGGFLRFSKWVPELFTRLQQKALETGTILLGVIEEIGSVDVVRSLGFEEHVVIQSYRDRDLFYGLLDVGEYFLLQPEHFFKPVEKGCAKKYGTSFVRFSADPQAIAIDYLSEQGEEIPEILNILSQITPHNSRGIPYWLDIVDQEVRINNQDIKSLLETHFDRSLIERFIRPMREKRDL